MGYENLKDLLALWKLDEVTVEQLQGQILQWAVESDELLVALNVRSKNTNNRLDAIEKKLNIKQP